VQNSSMFAYIQGKQNSKSQSDLLERHRAQIYWI